MANNIPKLTAEEKLKYKIGKREENAGKNGSPQIAALLTVEPENYSENQKWKVKKLSGLSKEQIIERMWDERIENNLGLEKGDPQRHPEPWD